MNELITLNHASARTLREQLEMIDAELVSHRVEALEIMDSKDQAGSRAELGSGGGDDIAIQKGRTESFVRQLESRRSEVVAALEAVEFGRYGVCVDCGNSIPSERLEAIPESTQCAPCASSVRGLINLR